MSVDPKVRANACDIKACREHDGAGRNNPGKGKRDADCCGAKGNTGCDVGFVHSFMTSADWAKVPGGRPAGFSACNTLSSHVGNTCCTKGLDVNLTMGLGGDTHTHALTRNSHTYTHTHTHCTDGLDLSLTMVLRGDSHTHIHQ